MAVEVDERIPAVRSCLPGANCGACGYTGCDGAMIGRGSFGDPWLFLRGNAAVAGQPIPPRPPLRERMETAREQIARSAALRGERVACLEARRHLAWYLRGVPYAGPYKAEAVHVETLEDVDRVVRRVQRELRDGEED